MFRRLMLSLQNSRRRKLHNRSKMGDFLPRLVPQNMLGVYVYPLWTYELASASLFRLSIFSEIVSFFLLLFACLFFPHFCPGAQSRVCCLHSWCYTRLWKELWTGRVLRTSSPMRNWDRTKEECLNLSVLILSSHLGSPTWWSNGRQVHRSSQASVSLYVQWVW